MRGALESLLPKIIGDHRTWEFFDRIANIPDAHSSFNVVEICHPFTDRLGAALLR